MKLKKVLAILLSLMMVFTNVPAMAFADTEVSSEESGETSDDQSYEEALAAAIKAAEEQAASQQYEIDQNTYTENDDTWTSVDEVVSPELGEPDEEDYAPEPEYEPEPEPEEVPEETAVEKPEQEATPQPEADAQTDAPATDAKENAGAPKKDETKVEEAATFASIVTNAKGKLNGLIAAKAFPAFNGAKNISGTSMRVAVEAPEGAFPTGIKLFAGVVETPAGVLDAIAADQGEEVSQDDALSIDIHFYLPEDPNTEIEPLVPINVTFSNINLDAETVDVYHEDEKVAEVDGEGGTVELDQFSTYTFVPTKGDPNTIADDGVNKYTVNDMEIRPVGLQPGDIPQQVRIYLEHNDTALNPDAIAEYWTFTAGSNVEISVNGVVTPKNPGSEKSKVRTNLGGSDVEFTVTTYGLVKYDANGGTGTAPADVEYSSYDINAAARGNLTRSRYVFKGWAMDSGATEPDVEAGGSLSTLLDKAYSSTDPDTWVTTLYAVWVPNPQVYIEAEKVWNDGGDDTHRGTVNASVYIGSKFQRQRALTAANGWKSTITAEQQLKYDEDGNEIQYQFRERYPEGSTVPDYYDSVVSDPTGDGSMDNPYIYTITNTLKEDITVSKTWVDDNDRDGIRPDSVEVTLTDESGTPVTDATGASTVTLDDSNSWSYTFTGLLAYDDQGDKINYSASETQTDVITGDADTGYESSVAPNPADANNIIVTNTHNPEKVEISVTKNWNDNGNAEGKRPDKLYLRVFRDGEYVRQNAISTTDDSTTVTITENPSKPELAFYKYHDGGVAYEYTVDEFASRSGEIVDVENYDKDIVKDSDYAFTITNTYIPETMDVTINKVWVDYDNANNTRPDAVTIRLINNGRPVARTTMHATDGWTKTFTDIPVKDSAGKIIDYYVEEENVEGYVASYKKEGDVLNGYTFTVTNTNEIPQENIQISVKKHWDDNNNQDGIRPDTISWKLEGKDGDQVVVTRNVTWENGKASTTISRDDAGNLLPKYHNGHEVVYSVTETPVAGYTTEVTGDATTGFVMTNTHEPEVFDLTVTKVWNDKNDQDGKRPETVTVVAKDDKGNTYEYDLSAEDEWEVTFQGLPRYAGGEVLTYSVEEPTVPDGYTSTVIDNGDDSFTITNEHTPEVWDSIAVSKTWIDGDNRDGKRPATIYARLAKNGVHYKQVALNEGNGWTGEIKGSESKPLYKYENGQLVEYTFTESIAQGSYKELKDYTMEVTGDPEAGFTITNTHEPELLEIKVTKVWDDDDDNDGFRPDEVYAVVCAPDGTRLRQRALSEHNGWSAVITAESQYKYENGEEIQYQVKESWEKGETVEEDPSGKYTTKITGDLNKGFTFTNTHEPEKITVTAKKVWDDDGNRDRKRPEKITLHLYANGENIQSVSTADTEYKFENLPKYVDRKEINYVVVESAVPDYTTSYVKEDPDEDGNFTWEITNKYEPEKKTITAIKAWNDGDNQDGNRPTEVTFKLQSKATGDWKDVESKTVSEANNWTATWTVNKNFKTGQNIDNEFQYQVIEDETALPDGYTATYAESNDIWTITNTYEPQTGSLKITKVWEDDDNRDGLRPANLSVTLKANGYPVAGATATLSEANGWETSFPNLPVKENGEDIEYTVEEVVPAGYTPSEAEVFTLTKDETKEITITNTHKPEVYETISVTKVWDDAGNQDGLREKIRIGIYANGNYVKLVAIENINDDVTTTAFNTSSQRPLFKYENGKEITYTIKEVAASTGEPLEDYTVAITGGPEEGFTITNTHQPETIDVTITKTWEDENDQAGFRPEYLEVQLVTGDTTVGEERLSAQNNWKVTFTDLPAYKDGEAIEYEAKEQRVAKYEQTGGDGDIAKVDGALTINLVNTHEPETVNVIVNKTWDDDDNRDQKRPESITLHLYANGKNVDSVTTADTTYTFENLPRYENAEEINYVVAEIPVENYTTEYTTSKDDEGNTTWDITNKYEPEMKTIVAIKEWDDNNDQDGKRPESVEFRLEYSTDNGETWKKMDGTDRVVNEDSYWKAEWQVKVNNKSGQPNLHRVVEKRLTIPEGYEVSYTERNGVWTVTNTHEPETGILAITKIWDDDDNRDGIRPASVTFDIMGSGENEYVREELTISQKTLDEDANEWTDFIEVPKYKNGEELVYYAVERAIEGYEPQGFIAEDGALELDYYDPADETTINEVTNKHEPETVTINVIKVWDDGDNQDGVRPVEVYAQVYANGEYQRQKELNEANGWSNTITAMKQYKYENGKEIKYEIKENWVKSGHVFEDPNGNYTTEITGSVEDGFTITNTHVPETIDVTVKKVWADEDNQDGIRPEYVEVQLMADGTKVDEQRLYFANGWSHLFEGLPAYKAGTAIKYTIEEQQAPDGYTATFAPAEVDVNTAEKIITVTNTHEPKNIDVTVNKIWDDDSNRDKKRPESITLYLMANGKNVASTTIEDVLEANNQSYVFEKVPALENGKPINYVVFEGEIPEYAAAYEKEETDAGDVTWTITNRRAPDMKTITAIKEWDDNDDQDGLRPEEVQVRVEYSTDNGETWKKMDGSERVLNEENYWKTEWQVKVNNKEGKPNLYKVVERRLTIPEGYTVSYLERDGVWTVTNTHIPETFFILIEKNWDDDNNRDGIRPASVSFEVMGVYVDRADNPHVSEQIVTLTRNSTDDDPNQWFKGIEVPKCANGETVAYIITEQVPDGYECTKPAGGYEILWAPDDDAADTPTASFTNKHEPELVEFDVTKVWDDADNQDGFRPDEVYVGVYANGERVRQRALNSENDWSTTIAAEKQYRYENGEEILYTVKESWKKGEVVEEDPNGHYTTEVTGNAIEGFTITNTHVPEEINLTVTKTWDDKDNQDGIRPEYVEVQLKKAVEDGEPTSVGDPVRIGEPTWDITYESLPKYEGGKPIKYFVEETAIDGYKATYAGKEDPSEAGVNGTADDADTYEYTLNITNSHEVEKTEITAIKHWDDENNHDKVRPNKILYTLYANGRVVASQEVEGDSTTDKDWDYTFEDLDKNEHGTEINYMIVEHSVENYTTIIDQKMEDINDDGIKELVCEITNKYEPEMTTITAVKEWYDDDNRDGKRTDSVEVKLLANGGDATEHIVGGGSATATLNDANNWATTWDVYVKNSTDGTDNVFSVEETPVDGYQVAYSETQGVFTIKNTHEPAMIDIPVEKTWTDMYDWDGIRPAQLVLKLTANGKLVPGQEISLEPKNEFQWTGVFRDLPVYEKGKAIEYSVIETVPAGYECYITPFNTQELIDDPDAEPIIRVQNIHDLETTNITATKIWDDADDLDGYREAARKATKLALQVSINGKEYQAADIIFEELEKTVEALKEFIEEVDWLDDDQKAEIIAAIEEAVKESYIEISKRPHLEMGLDDEELADDKFTWEDLPVKYHGQDISYRVVEINDGSDAAKKYTSEVVETDPGMFEITNTHELDTVSHTVSIKWDDNNNQDGLRPAYVNVYLMKDGVRTDDPVVALSPANGWTYTWENLIAGEYTTGEENVQNPEDLMQGAGPGAPATAGTKAAYSADAVTPLDPDVYEKASTTTADDTTTIELKYTPKAISVKGYKYWEDDSNRDGARPQSITLNLYADGDLIKTMDITAENAIDEAGNVWAYEFKDLPRYIDGHLVHYSVSEVAVPNYTLRVEGFDLHNTYTPGKTFMTVIKLWNDDRNRDGIRPDNIIVRLYANGTEINRKSISAASGWFAVFEGLNMMDGQQNVTYTITEDAVQDYETSITGDQKAGYVITNTHTSERTEVPVTKIWDDNDNAAKMRPTGITVNLLVEGRVVDTRILTEADGWKTTFTDLPKYSNGKEVVYTISENPVAGYSSSINGYTITNTLKCDGGGHKGTSGGSGKRSGGVKTGDEANITLWILLLIIAVVAIVVARRFRRKTR